MGRETKDEVVRFRLNERLKEDLDAITAETGEAMSVIVRAALKEYITRYRAKHPEAKPTKGEE